MTKGFKIVPARVKVRDKYYFIIVGFVGSVVAIILGIYIIATFGKILKINVSLEQLYKRIDSYRRGMQNYPSPEREVFLMEQKRGLESILANIREYPVFWDKIIDIDVETTSPLKFKEELFRTKNTLQRQADKNGVILSKDIGFSTWEKKLPQPSQIEDLYKALEVVIEVSEIAINSYVEEVEEIQVSNFVEMLYSDSGSKQKYYEREIRMRLRGKCSEFVQFLYGINTSRILLHVKDMRVYNIHSSGVTAGRDESNSSKKNSKDTLDPLLVGEFTIINTCL